MPNSPTTDWSNPPQRSTVARTRAASPKPPLTKVPPLYSYRPRERGNRPIAVPAIGDIQKMLLIALALGLAVGAVLVCISIIAGASDARIILADYAFVGFSLLGLISTVGKDRPWSPTVSAAGIGASMLGLMVAVIAILTPTVSGAMLKAVGVTVVVPGYVAYCAVILLAVGNKMAVNAVAAGSTAMAGIFSLFLIAQILSAHNLGTGTYKVWAIVGVFTALGTVVTPILSRALAD